MIGFSALLALSLNLQIQQQAPATAPVPSVSGSSAPYSVALPTDTGATAVRADVSPVIDGRDDDQVWRAAPPITAFKEWRPNEDKPPRFKTEAKIAYDASNLYVFVRAFDPHPDSIIKLLERRDTSIDDALAELEEAVPLFGPASVLRTAVLESMLGHGEHDDDVAVIALAVPGGG